MLVSAIHAQVVLTTGYFRYEFVYIILFLINFLQQ